MRHSNQRSNILLELPNGEKRLKTIAFSTPSIARAMLWDGSELALGFAGVQSGKADLNFDQVRITGRKGTITGTTTLFANPNEKSTSQSEYVVLGSKIWGRFTSNGRADVLAALKYPQGGKRTASRPTKLEPIYGVAISP